MNSDKNTDGKYAMQCGNSETLYAQQVKKWFQELRIGGRCNRSTLSPGTSIPRRVYLHPAPVQMKMEN